MVDVCTATQMSPQRRAAYIRGVVVRYLTRLNQLLPSAQSYSEKIDISPSTDRLADLVDFGLSHQGALFAGLTSLQANLLVLDATGRYARDMKRQTTWDGTKTVYRQSRRVTSKMIRKRFKLPKTRYEREMATARSTILANMGAS